MIDDTTLRLGLCYLKRLSIKDAESIIRSREQRPFTSLHDFQLRTGLGKAAQRVLAMIGALNGLADHRRAALWKVETERNMDDLFSQLEEKEDMPLSQMNLFERVSADYKGSEVSTGPHPISLIRNQFLETVNSSALKSMKTGEMVTVIGMVICRQRPGTAKGFVFLSLEDEVGITNIVVVPDLFNQNRLLIREEGFLKIYGQLQNVENVIHVKAITCQAINFQNLQTPSSHDFH